MRRSATSRDLNPGITNRIDDSFSSHFSVAHCSQRQAGPSRRRDADGRPRQSSARIAALADHIKIEPLNSRRLALEPLKVTHAPVMATIIGDPSLYAFIGGSPMTLAQVKSLYQRLEGGSPDPCETWLNWVLRSRDQSALVGTIQVTVWPDRSRAEIAWIVGAAWQGRGIATEAAAQVVQWLRRRGIRLVIAHIHPDHGASQAVARHIGLTPTTTVVDGEVEWEVELA